MYNSPLPGIEVTKLVRVKPKRRLPLVPSEEAAADAGPARPSWQWIVFGAFGIFVVWLPVSALGARVARTTAALAAASTLGLAVASLAGGLLLGRWGGPGIGVREGALAGLLAALVAILGAGLELGFSPGSLLVGAVAIPLAAAGAALGLRRRARGGAG